MRCHFLDAMGICSQMIIPIFSSHLHVIQIGQKLKRLSNNNWDNMLTIDRIL